MLDFESKIAVDFSLDKTKHDSRLIVLHGEILDSDVWFAKRKEMLVIFYN